MQKYKEGAICAILREKNPFLAFPEAKKGVVSCARLHKAAHWPNNNANPLGLSEKKSLLCRKARYVRSLGKKPHFWPSQRLKKVLLVVQHAGPAEGTKLHARKNFCVFYPIELKLCTMIELFIPNNRIVFVFAF